MLNSKITALEPLHLGGDVLTPIGHGSGLLGTPGDLTPPSRLVRAATLTHFADPVKTKDETVNLAIHILNTVDIPHGVATEDYTNWIVAKDLTHKELYSLPRRRSWGFVTRSYHTNGTRDERLITSAWEARSCTIVPTTI